MQAIIFDMDDTLYPERAYVLSGFRAVAGWAERQWGIPAAAGYERLAALFAAGVRGDTFNRWLAEWGLPTGERIPELVRVYREHRPQIRPFPELPALLADLGGRYRLGLVSDGYLAVQQRKWSALGLAAHFDAVVFSDEWGRAAWKPSQRPFVEVTARLGVAPAAATYIGDNPLKDFLGARQLGLATIWLRHPDGEYSRHEPPTPAHAPDRIVTALTALHHL